MKIETRKIEDIHILDLKGKITIGGGDVQLREEVKKMLDDGVRKILLNLQEVKYMDSSGVGELVASFTTVRNGGGEIKLLNLTKKIKDLLQITQLLTVFDSHTSEAEAVADFMKGN